MRDTRQTDSVAYNLQKSGRPDADNGVGRHSRITVLRAYLTARILVNEGDHGENGGIRQHAAHRRRP